MKRMMHGLIAGLLGLTLVSCGSTVEDEPDPVPQGNGSEAYEPRDPVASPPDARDERPAPRDTREDRFAPSDDPIVEPEPEDRFAPPDSPVVEPAPGADEPRDPMDEDAVTPDVTEEPSEELPGG